MVGVGRVERGLVDGLGGRLWHHHHIHGLVYMAGVLQVGWCWRPTRSAPGLAEADSSLLTDRSVAVITYALSLHHHRYNSDLIRCFFLQCLIFPKCHQCCHHHNQELRVNTKNIIFIIR